MGLRTSNLSGFILEIQTPPKKEEYYVSCKVFNTIQINFNLTWMWYIYIIY